MCSDISAANSECQDTVLGLGNKGVTWEAAVHIALTLLFALSLFSIKRGHFVAKVTLTEGNVFIGVQKEELKKNSTYSVRKA